MTTTTARNMRAQNGNRFAGKPGRKPRRQPTAGDGAAAGGLAEGKVRIHKYLASRGVASRRAVEQMLIDGRISVNGRQPDRLPCFVTPDVDEIRLDGRVVAKRAARKVYFLLNKPRGIVCTMSDPQGRTRTVDLIPQVPQRVYTVGRLDADSTGIIVLTNDGELTQLLTHPGRGVAKTYVVDVDGRITGDQLNMLKSGGWIDGKRTAPLAVKVLKRSPKRSVLSITLTEGRNREIRRLLARQGHNVRRLKRVAIGPITNRGLKIGSFRALTPTEITKLRSAASRTEGRTTTARKASGDKHTGTSRAASPPDKHAAKRPPTKRAGERPPAKSAAKRAGAEKLAKPARTKRTSHGKPTEATSARRSSTASAAMRASRQSSKPAKTKRTSRGKPTEATSARRSSTARTTARTTRQPTARTTRQPGKPPKTNKTKSTTGRRAKPVKHSRGPTSKKRRSQKGSR